MDFETISLDDYQEKLASADLVPSRRILHEDIEENFDGLKQLGIQNLSELIKSLKTRENIQNAVEETGISEQYLTILVREVKSMQPKPMRLIDFPEIPEEEVLKLHDQGIKNTVRLFDQVTTNEKRQQLSNVSGVDPQIILRLAHLTDLTRIRWVNHTFAYMLYETGYTTANAVANANPEDLYEVINTINREKNFYRGKIGLHDMKLCVLAAQDVKPEIQF